MYVLLEAERLHLITGETHLPKLMCEVQTQGLNSKLKVRRPNTRFEVQSQGLRSKLKARGPKLRFEVQAQSLRSKLKV
jgi:hypothetical protein